MSIQRSMSYDQNEELYSSYTASIQSTSTVRSNGLYRQSSVISTEDTCQQETRKLIKNRTEFVVLVSMALIYFIGLCAFSMIAPFFPKQAKGKGADETTVGLIFAVYPFVMFLVAPIIGKYMPLIGVKFTLLAGCFLEGGTEILFGFVADIEDKTTFIAFCFLIRSITAVGSACTETAILSINSVTFKENLSTVLGMLEVFSGIGLMVGPTFGGLLFKYGGFKMPFAVMGGMVLVVLICVAYILPGNEAYIGTDDDDSPKTGSFFGILFVPGVFILTTTAFSGGAILSFLDPTLAAQLEKITNNGLTTEKIGLIFMISPFIYTVFAPIVGYISDKKIKGMYLIVMGNVASFIAYFFLGPSPLVDSFMAQSLWSTCLALLLLGFGIAPLFVPCLLNMNTYASKAGHTTSLATSSILSGIFNSAFSIGSVVGPTLGGVLTTHLSFAWASTMFSFALFTQLIFLIIFIIWDNHVKCDVKTSDETKPLLPSC